MNETSREDIRKTLGEIRSIQRHMTAKEHNYDLNLQSRKGKNQGTIKMSIQLTQCVGTESEWASAASSNVYIVADCIDPYDQRRVFVRVRLLCKPARSTSPST